jgi:hypothetical protein
LDPKLAGWEEGRAVLGSLFVAAGQGRLRERIEHLSAEVSSEAVRIGLRTGADILDDGADTVYNPEFWVVEQGFAPEPLNSLFEGMFNEVADTVKETSDAVNDVATADVAGAVIGAVRGFLTGGQAGATKGAVTGAVAGSVKAATGGEGVAH